MLRPEAWAFSHILVSLYQMQGSDLFLISERAHECVGRHCINTWVLQTPDPRAAE